MYMTFKNKFTRNLCVGAMFVALATVLSFIPVWEMPLGGKISLLSMVPIVMISVMYGLRWGFFTSFVYSVIQLLIGLPELMTWGMDARMWFGSLAFDYIVAFTVLGIAGIFRNKGTVGIVAGVAIALALRFASHLISGWIFFDAWMPESFNNPFIYSVVYNGSYMLPELIITCIAVGALFKIPVAKRLIIE